jgi:hypothetical protein
MIPTSDTKLGSALRAMAFAGPMTAGGIRKKANLAPDTAVTARIRDLRKMGCVVSCYNVPQGDGKQLWYYRMDHMPEFVRKALTDEMKRRAAA